MQGVRRSLVLIAVVTLSWTAPADNVGVVAYDIRYSLAPITEANFDQATQVIGEPMPRATFEFAIPKGADVLDDRQ